MAEASRPSADDIAYIRHLSESGARAPLIGGRFMAWWGLLLAIAYVAQHLATNRIIGDGNFIFGIIWGSFGLLGATGQVFLARSIAGKPGQGSAGNLAMRAVWMAGAFSIGAMVVGTALISDNRIMGLQPWDFIVPVGFAVYACALGVTGSLADNRILKLAAAGAILTVGLFTALMRLPERYLIVAAAVVFTLMLPGLLLMRAEPKG
ncbi:MAG TPA: hypothetical protein VMG08_20475 [Allosphingosinicella sp.]|nr:hypothetical protein [Allosphingosinicella sp.]